MEVLKGQALTAPKLMIYGLSGVGKSSLAAKLKKPLFLDFEGGLNYLGVDRTPQYTNLESFYADLVELYRKAESGKRDYDTLVIDSVDWLVRKVVETAAGIDKHNLTETLNRSNGGYGNGKQVLENHIRTKLLPLLVALNKQGYGICLVAHAERKDLMDADGIDIERLAPKIDVNTMNVFVEWCDNVFYLKNADGERSLILEGDSNVLAKNRLGLTGEIKLADTDINNLLIPKKGDK
jgi:phage nucleotide-binding protein